MSVHAVQIKAKREVAQRIVDCEACGLHSSMPDTPITPDGPLNPDLLILLPFPGTGEASRGEWEDGKMAKLLKRKLVERGVDWDKVMLMGTVQCTPKNKQSNGRMRLRASGPNVDEMRECRGHVNRAIHVYHPKMIVTVGGKGLDAWRPDLRIGNRHVLGSVGLWRFALANGTLAIPVVPIANPDTVKLSKSRIQADDWECQLDIAASLVEHLAAGGLYQPEDWQRPKCVGDKGTQYAGACIRPVSDVDDDGMVWCESCWTGEGTLKDAKNAGENRAQLAQEYWANDGKGVENVRRTGARKKAVSRGKNTDPNQAALI